MFSLNGRLGFPNNFVEAGLGLDYHSKLATVKGKAATTSS
jgi:hypothetical protein